jgi:hypothetical protein
MLLEESLSSGDGGMEEGCGGGGGGEARGEARGVVAS